MWVSAIDGLPPVEVTVPVSPGGPDVGVVTAAVLRRRLSRRGGWLVSVGVIAALVVAAVILGTAVGAGAQERDAEARCRAATVGGLVDPAELTRVRALTRTESLRDGVVTLLELNGDDPDAPENVALLGRLVRHTDRLTAEDAAVGQRTWFVQGDVGAWSTFNCEITYRSGEVRSGPTVAFRSAR